MAEGGANILAIKAFMPHKSKVDGRLDDMNSRRIFYPGRHFSFLKTQIRRPSPRGLGCTTMNSEENIRWLLEL